MPFPPLTPPMPTRPIRLACLLGLLLLVAPGAAAQSAAFEGTFAYVAAGSDDVHAAIDRAVAGLNFAFRPIARSRLRRTNSPYRTLEIRRQNASLAVSLDGGAPIVSPESGTPTSWRRADGEVLQVSTAWEGGRLRQSFVAEDGRRDNHYTVSEDGRRLTLEVTVTSPRLNAPLRYRLNYVRTGD
jgi:hypothetical protein